MPEPTTTASTGTSLAVMAVVLLGPNAGPYALIVFAALSGALWALSAAPPVESRRAGAWLLLRVVLAAVVFTGLFAHLLQRYADIEPGLATGPIAFLIAALGNDWRGVLTSLGAAVRAMAARSAGTASDKQKRGRQP